MWSVELGRAKVKEAILSVRSWRERRERLVHWSGLRAALCTTPSAVFISCDDDRVQEGGTVFFLLLFCKFFLEMQIKFTEKKIMKEVCTVQGAVEKTIGYLSSKSPHPCLFTCERAAGGAVLKGLRKSVSW